MSSRVTHLCRATERKIEFSVPIRRLLWARTNNTLMRWLLGFENDVASFLVDDLIAPASAERLDEIVPAQVLRDPHP